MSFGKVYTNPGNSRSRVLRAVAKANKLDIEFVDARSLQQSPEYLKFQPLNKIPAFEGSDGYIVSECIAIAVYLTSQNEKTTLLGKTKQDYASILRWMSFINAEHLVPTTQWLLPLLGRLPYNKKSVDEAQEKMIKSLNVLEQHLLVNTFFVGERITLADLFAAGILCRVFSNYLDPEKRKTYPCLTRFYETIINQPLWKEAIPDQEPLCTEALKNVPPKTDAAPKKEKAAKPAAAAAPKAAPKPAAEEEEDEAPKPKAKHPLDALPRPTLVLDDWKRKYSNEDTREVALPWFWQNFKSDEYSLWTIDYKYNEELTLTFMTSNLIGGFFARLEASRKFLFGATSVYGENNNSIIKGCFMVRGQEALPAFDVAPDYESYEFTKLDPTKQEDQDFVNNQWSWDKPIIVNGKTYEWADGKVFK